MLKKKGAGIYPTLACADYLHLADDLAVLEKAGVTSFHIDIMDGNFVPNYCLNFDYLKAVKGFSSIPCDVHLMTTEVEMDIQRSIGSGADAVAFHVERSDLDIPSLLSSIRREGRRAGLVISPETPVSALSPYDGMYDYVIMMGVKPGFSGQKFIEGTYDRLRQLSGARERSGSSFEIIVDGGIDFDNARPCISCGADSIVAGALNIFSHQKGLEKDTERLMKALE